VGDEPVLCTADYLTSKPVEKEKLFSVVENLLFGKEPANPDEAEPMLKILIVDDNQDNLFLLKNWLAKKNNIEILTSSNGLDAVALFETEKPEVVFLDIQMPGMNGIEVLEEIRSRDGNCTVIMMTAYGSEDIAVQSMKQGANDYLSKPIDYRRILKVLEENLEQARLRTKNRQLMEQLKAANRELYRKYTLLQEAIAHIEAGQEEIIKAQRISAITETAVSLNHEINNPLCSIMGNAELLGMMLSDADEKIRRKLEIITRESSRIHETTKKLSNLMEPVLTEYISGVQMIDLKKSK
jgi:DNA-binding response OmpR family regulator